MKQRFMRTGSLILLIIFAFSDCVLGEELIPIGTLSPDDSFIVKLGTFLFITAVLLFLLQWRRNKKQ